MANTLDYTLGHATNLLTNVGATVEYERYGKGVKLKVTKGDLTIRLTTTAGRVSSRSVTTLIHKLRR